jgi:hypothetical protein
MAPDCIVSDEDGEMIAVEVTELVCEEAIRENQRGNRVYRDWQPTEVVSKLEERLKEKDRKEYHCGPYGKIVVLIYTNEPVICYYDYQTLLAPKQFTDLRQIAEAYLLLSYDPSVRRYPYIRIA